MSWIVHICETKLQLWTVEKTYGAKSCRVSAETSWVSRAYKYSSRSWSFPSCHRQHMSLVHACSLLGDRKPFSSLCLLFSLLAVRYKLVLLQL